MYFYIEFKLNLVIINDSVLIFNNLIKISIIKYDYRK